MPNELSKNKLLEELTKLNQDNMEAIKQFSDNYTEVMNHLTQPQMETAAVVEEAIKKLRENYRTVTDLTRRQKEMVDGYMGEAAEKTVEAINQAVANSVKATKEAITIAQDYAKRLKDAKGGAIHGRGDFELHPRIAAIEANNTKLFTESDNTRSLISLMRFFVKIQYPTKQCPILPCDS
jgi:heme oxygenase